MSAAVKPDWAPDNCPDAVVQLIEHDDLLNRLQLRGLASAVSKDVHRATERLKFLFTERYREGWADAMTVHRADRLHAFLAGLAAGMGIAGLVIAAAFLL